MFTRQKLSRIITMLVVVTLLPGCATLPVSPLPEEIRWSVQVGDRVHVVTKDGEKHRFKVTAINEDSLVGKKQVIPFDQIDTIEREDAETNKRRMWIAIGTVALIALLVSSPSGGGYAPY